MRPLIGVTASSEREARRYLEAVQAAGGETLLLLPSSSPPLEEVLVRIDGLLVSGGPDIHPRYYGEEPDPRAGLELDEKRDAMELPLLREALERDLPVLCICRGMQVLNVVLGGRLIQDLPGHKAEWRDGRWASAYHRIWISPGSRLAKVLGSGGLVRVNSRHHQGLREAHKSPLLLASAYSEEGLIEGLESPRHRWVVGVQCHPERGEEVPRQFQNLFRALVQEAGRGR